MAQKRSFDEFFEYDEATKRELHDYRLFRELYDIIIDSGKNDEVQHWLDCNEGNEMLLQAVSKIVKRNEYKPPLHLILLHVKDVSLDMVERLIKIFPESVTQTCGEGLPLHIAINQECSDDIINTLLRSYPDGVLVKNYHRDSPLHIAIKNRCSEDIITCLVDAHPDGVQVKNSCGELPLHMAIDFGFPLQTVRNLVKAYHKSVSVENFDGKLPLHHIRDSHVDILEFLLKAYPEGIKCEDGYGMLPLHCAIERGCSLQIIEILVAEYPESVSIPDESGCLPLHKTVMNDQSDAEAMLKFLLEKYPAGVKAEDDEGNFPLDYAIHPDYFSLNTTKILVEAYKESAQYIDEEGNLPLHLVIQRGLPLEVVRIMVEAYPEGVTVKNNDGRLPLHDAVHADPYELNELARDEGHCDVEVLKFILNKYPEGAKCKDGYGNLPLHSAIQIDLSLEIVNILIKCNSESLSVKTDDDGELPLHIAAANGNVEVLKILMELYPKGVEEKDKKGNSPLHLACQYKASIEVVKILLGANKDLSKQKNKSGDLPLHLACENSSQEKEEKVRILLKTYPLGVTVQNKNGSLPLHVACKHEKNVGVIKILLDDYRGGVNVTDNLGRLPLHIECAKSIKADIRVLNLLIECNPESINQRNIAGDYPSNLFSTQNPRALNQRYGDDALAIRTYHSKIACALREAVVKKFSPHLVKLLVKASPESILTKDQNGRIPLHHACASNTIGSLDIVLTFLEASEESFMIPDKHGMTPSKLLSNVASRKNANGMLSLHRHARYSERFTVSALHQLFNAYPKGIEERDNRGMLPFHHACLNTASSVDTLMALLQLYPESIAVVESQVPKF